MNDEIPAWAIELIKQVERLNEKIPTHIDWVERNMKDHEVRIRNLERRIWMAMGGAAAIGAAVSYLMQII
jgi:chaperonin cofactor prefoldin